MNSTEAQTACCRFNLIVNEMKNKELAVTSLLITYKARLDESFGGWNKYHVVTV